MTICIESNKQHKMTKEKKIRRQFLTNLTNPSTPELKLLTTTSQLVQKK
jgi:hypothetical protein